MLEALAEVAPEIDAGKLEGGVPLRDQLDLDSVDVLNFLVALEKRLGVSGPETDAAAVARELSGLGREEVMRLIASLEEDMTSAAEALDFETAARLRDQVVKLRVEVESSPESEVLERLKKGSRKGSSHGSRRRRR